MARCRNNDTERERSDVKQKKFGQWSGFGNLKKKHKSAKQLIQYVSWQTNKDPDEKKRKDHHSFHDTPKENHHDTRLPRIQNPETMMWTNRWPSNLSRLPPTNDQQAQAVVSRDGDSTKWKKKTIQQDPTKANP